MNNTKKSMIPSARIRQIVLVLDEIINEANNLINQGIDPRSVEGSIYLNKAINGAIQKTADFEGVEVSTVSDKLSRQANKCSKNDIPIRPQYLVGLIFTSPEELERILRKCKVDKCSEADDKLIDGLMEKVKALNKLLIKA